MKKLGKTYEAHIYDGAGHGFLRDQDGRRRREHEGDARSVAADGRVPEGEAEVLRGAYEVADAAAMRPESGGSSTLRSRRSGRVV